MLLVVGVIHTGIAYVLYFGSVQKMPSQTVAVLSYIDPVGAILLAWLILGEGDVPGGDHWCNSDSGRSPGQ